MKLLSPHETLLNSRMSSDDIAKAMQLSSGALLRNKLNPNNTINRLSLEEAVELMLVTGDNRIAHDICQRLGLVAIPITLDHITADCDIIDGMAKAWQSSGEVGKNIHQAIADGDITQAEIDKVTTSIHAMVADLFNIRQRMIEMKE